MQKSHPKKKLAHHQHKRHAGHHNKGKHYLKTYAPYLPLVVFSLSAILLSATHFSNQSQVLSYATVKSSDLLLETNQERAKSQLPNLTLNPALTTAAQTKANDMVARNYWSHTSPDGQQPWLFITNAGYAYHRAGENLAYGFSSSQDTIKGWMQSPGHRQNILDQSFQEVGFGITEAQNFNGNGAKTVIVALYGMPQTTSSPLTSVNQTYPTQVAGQNISRGALIGDKYGTWVTFMVGVISGCAVAIVLVRHGLAVRHVIRQGERFVAHHFLFDATLISLTLLCAVLSQTAGFIK